MDVALGERVRTVGLPTKGVADTAEARARDQQLRRVGGGLTAPAQDQPSPVDVPDREAGVVTREAEVGSIVERRDAAAQHGGRARHPDRLSIRASGVLANSATAAALWLAEGAAGPAVLGVGADKAADSTAACAWKSARASTAGAAAFVQHGVGVSAACAGHGGRRRARQAARIAGKARLAAGIREEAKRATRLAGEVGLEERPVGAGCARRGVRAFLAVHVGVAHLAGRGTERVVHGVVAIVAGGLAL